MWEDYFYELLNPKPNPKLQTTVHSIEHLHLHACELNEEVKQAVFANGGEKTLSFYRIKPLLPNVWFRSVTYPQIHPSFTILLRLYRGIYLHNPLSQKHSLEY